MWNFSPFILLVTPVQPSALVFLEETGGPFNPLEGGADEPENERVTECTRPWESPAPDVDLVVR